MWAWRQEQGVHISDGYLRRGKGEPKELETNLSTELWASGKIRGSTQLGHQEAGWEASASRLFPPDMGYISRSGQSGSLLPEAWRISYIHCKGNRVLMGERTQPSLPHSSRSLPDGAMAPSPAALRTSSPSSVPSSLPLSPWLLPLLSSPRLPASLFLSPYVVPPPSPASLLSPLLSIMYTLHTCSIYRLWLCVLLIEQ